MDETRHAGLEKKVFVDTFRKLRAIYPGMFLSPGEIALYMSKDGQRIKEDQISAVARELVGEGQMETNGRGYQWRC